MEYIFYVKGILLLTLGISLTIQSHLGTSPFDVVSVGLSMNGELTVYEQTMMKIIYLWVSFFQTHEAC